MGSSSWEDAGNINRSTGLCACVRDAAYLCQKPVEVEGY